VDEKRGRVTPRGAQLDFAARYLPELEGFFVVRGPQAVFGSICASRGNHPASTMRRKVNAPD
jgi:hypothetical protein